MSAVPDTLGIIAGNGRYPFLLAREAREAGVRRLVAAAFEKETDPALAREVDEIAWLRVGQLGKLCKYFGGRGVPAAIMAGQIAPGNLFDLRPDLKALIVLATLKERNAESIFGAIADELAKAGTELLPATTFMERHLAPEGHFAGPEPARRVREDVAFGYRIAKETSRLDIGQTVVVKKGTVLAVEAFEGTDEAARRGGKLGRGGAVLVKVSKPNQDFRFDVPVFGPRTLESARDSGIAVLACEANKTLLLEDDTLRERAAAWKISLVGIEPAAEDKTL
ncbi:MAG: UDP-2,3-diacylglucosamine diphosphatase LpxI [Verrucomicrobiota bacterium]